MRLRSNTNEALLHLLVAGDSAGNRVTNIPELQRWLNRDPIRELGHRVIMRALLKAGTKADSNGYLFVGNKPISQIDPDGRDVACALIQGFFAFAKAGVSAAIDWVDNRGWENSAAAPDVITELRKFGFTNEDFDLLDWGLDNTTVGRLIKKLGANPNDKYLHCVTACEMSSKCGAPFATAILGVLNEVADAVGGDGGDLGDIGANSVGIGCSMVGGVLRIPWLLIGGCDKCCKCAGYKP